MNGLADYEDKGDVVYADFGVGEAGDEAARRTLAAVDDAMRFLGEMQRRTAILKMGVDDPELAHLVTGEVTEMARLARGALRVAVLDLEEFID